MRCAEFIGDSSGSSRVAIDRGGATLLTSFSLFPLKSPSPVFVHCVVGYRSSFSRTLRLASTTEQPLPQSVRSLQPELEGAVVGGELPGYGSEVSGEVLCGVLIIS